MKHIFDKRSERKIIQDVITKNDLLNILTPVLSFFKDVLQFHTNGFL